MPTRKTRCISDNMYDFISKLNDIPDNLTDIEVTQTSYSDIAGSVTLKDLCDAHALLEVQYPHYNAHFIIRNILLQIYAACANELQGPWNNVIKVKRFLIQFYKSTTEVGNIADLLKEMPYWEVVKQVHQQINLSEPLIIINSKPFKRSIPSKGPNLYKGTPAKHGRAHPYNTNNKNGLLKKSPVSCS